MSSLLLANGKSHNGTHYSDPVRAITVTTSEAQKPQSDVRFHGGGDSGLVFGTQSEQTLTMPLLCVAPAAVVLSGGREAASAL